MNPNNQTQIIELLGKSLPIKCPPDKAEDLSKAAQYLDKQMRLIREGGKAINSEHICLLAALNITYELLTTQRQKDLYIDSMGSRIRDLHQKIDLVLQEEELVAQG